MTIFKGSAMHCILHIGMEKTGTTLIQDWLYSNKDKLADEKVFLSSVLGIKKNRRLVSYFQEELDQWFYSQGIMNKKEKNQFFVGFEKDFRDEVKKASLNHDVMIITSEHFHSRLCTKREINNVRELLNDIFDSVTVVCYFREQSAMRKSLYSTALKVGHTILLENFYSDISEETYYYNCYSIAKLWSDIFGKDNCIFKIYDKKFFIEQDIRRDFIGVLDIDSSNLNYVIESSNLSLSYIQAELLREINVRMPFWNKKNGINPENKKFKNAILEADFLKIGSIQTHNDIEIYNSFVNSNKMFFDAFFDGNLQFQKPKKKEVNIVNISLERMKDTLIKFLQLMLELTVENPDNKILKDSDADYLRDIALKYESEEKLTVEDAEKMMSLASKIRPKSEFIHQKLKEYRKIINS